MQTETQRTSYRGKEGLISEYFITDFVNNMEMIKSLVDKILSREPGFANWTNREKTVSRIL